MSDTNSGEAFGQAGIGVYGKKWLHRGKSLRVEFNYRSRRQQKAVQRIRLPVESVDAADEAMRLWLQAKKQQPVTKTKCETLFLRPIDNSVQECSYHEFQNAVIT